MGGTLDKLKLSRRNELQILLERLYSSGKRTELSIIMADIAESGPHAQHQLIR